MKKYTEINLLNENGQYEHFGQIWETFYTTAPRYKVVEIANQVYKKWEKIPYDPYEDILEEDRLEPMSEEIKDKIRELGFEVEIAIPFENIYLWDTNMEEKVIK